MIRIYFLLAVIFIASTASNAQSPFSISISGSYLSATGSLGDAYKDGFGSYISLDFNLSEEFQFSITSGYSQLTLDNFQNPANPYGQFSNYSFYGLSPRLRIIPLMLGGKYYFTNSEIIPYAAFDFGIHIVTTDTQPTIVAGRNSYLLADGSGPFAAWGAGAGLLIKLSKSTALDINAKYNSNNGKQGTNYSGAVSLQSSSASSKSYISFLSLGAGFTFGL